MRPNEWSVSPRCPSFSPLKGCMSSLDLTKFRTGCKVIPDEKHQCDSPLSQKTHTRCRNQPSWLTDFRSSVLKMSFTQEPKRREIPAAAPSWLLGGGPQSGRRSGRNPGSRHRSRETAYPPRRVRKRLGLQVSSMFRTDTGV